MRGRMAAGEQALLRALDIDSETEKRRLDVLSAQDFAENSELIFCLQMVTKSVPLRQNRDLVVAIRPGLMALLTGVYQLG